MYEKITYLKKIIFVLIKIYSNYFFFLFELLKSTSQIKLFQDI